MAIPACICGAGAFKHFLEQEQALTPENVAAAERLAAWSAKKGVGSPSQVALACVLRRPEVSSAIIGASSVGQLEENVKSAEIKLSDAEWKEVEKVVQGSASGGNKAAGPKAKEKPASKVKKKARA